MMEIQLNDKITFTAVHLTVFLDRFVEDFFEKLQSGRTVDTTIEARNCVVAEFERRMAEAPNTIELVKKENHESDKASVN